LVNSSSLGESTDFAAVARKIASKSPPIKSPEVVASDPKSSQKVARRQSQILGSQQLPKVAQMALFAQSGNPGGASNSVV